MNIWSTATAVDHASRIYADRRTNIVDGPELSTFGAGGAWIIDARVDGTVVIQGTCDGT